MALESPLDLVTESNLPSTLEWLALRQMPTVPSDLAAVRAVAIAGLLINQQWGAPQFFDPTEANWRTWQVVISGPSDPADYPYQWAGLAVVDAAGAGVLLALFAVTKNNDLASYGQSQVVNGYFQVSKYKPNG